MNTLNEWTQVYANGMIPREGGTQNNLREITLQLQKSGKSPNQVYAILRGMGIDDQKSRFAVCSYMAVEKNKIIMEKNFNISDLETIFENLKISLLALVKEEDSKFRYSAQKALKITELYQNRISDFKGRKEELKTISEALEDLNSRNNKGIYEGAIMEFAQKKTSLENYVNDREITEKFELVKKSFVDYDSSINWLNPISEMLNDFRVLVNSNLFSFKLREALSGIKNSKHSSLYKAAETDITELCKLSEAGVQEELMAVLEKHSWIKEVNTIIKEFVKYKNLVSSNGNGIVNKVYSPVKVNENNTITFHLNGNFLVVENDKIRPVKDSSEMFDGRLNNLIKVMEMFKITNESFQLFNGSKYLEIFTDNGQIKINDIMLESSNIADIRNYLIQSAFFRLDEGYKIDQVSLLIESLEDIKELDFIYSIDSSIHENINISVLNYGDNIYVNRVNTAMGINEFVEPNNASHAQELVNEYINYDISNMVYEHLENEMKQIAELNVKKNEIKENIKFLESKISETKMVIKEIGAENNLQKAIHLLENELNLQEKSLQDVYISIGKLKNGSLDESDSLLDKGYVEAEVTKNTSGLKKGDIIYVLADDYTQSGKNDDITYLVDEKSKESTIKKDFIKIK
jgi:hypothetical protein